MLDQPQLPFDKRKRKPRPAVVLTSNQLTLEVISHIRKLGGWAARINVSGFYDVEKGYWRKGTTDPGTPVVLACLHGRFLGIEVKIGADQLGKYKVITKQAIEGTGGLYLIARNIAQFREDLREIFQT